MSQLKIPNSQLDISNVNFISQLHTNAFLTAQTTQVECFKRASRAILLEHKFAVCCKNRARRMHKLCGHNAEISMLKHVLVFSRVKGLISLLLEG
jgi:hypothetical protein